MTGLTLSITLFVQDTLDVQLYTKYVDRSFIINADKHYNSAFYVSVIN